MYLICERKNSVFLVRNFKGWSRFVVDRCCIGHVIVVDRCCIKIVCLFTESSIFLVICVALFQICERSPDKNLHMDFFKYSALAYAQIISMFRCTMNIYTRHKKFPIRKCLCTLCYRFRISCMTIDYTITLC